MARRFAVGVLLLGSLVAARRAEAGGFAINNLVGASGLTIDGPESGSGVSEHYHLDASGSNTLTTSVVLTVTARANGAAVPGSSQMFVLAAQTNTFFQYDFTLEGSSPASVGLFFSESPVGTSTTVTGTFTSTHAPAPSAPALPLAARASLVALLAGAGLCAVRRRRAVAG
jgi:hypothetical protein